MGQHHYRTEGSFVVDLALQSIKTPLKTESECISILLGVVDWGLGKIRENMFLFLQRPQSEFNKKGW